MVNREKRGQKERGEEQFRLEATNFSPNFYGFEVAVTKRRNETTTAEPFFSYKASNCNGYSGGDRQLQSTEVKQPRRSKYIYLMLCWYYYSLYALQYPFIVFTLFYYFF